MNLTDITQLFAYTEWANNLALDAARQLSDEQLRHDFKCSHGCIFGTLVHIAGAEWAWLQRWQGNTPNLEQARSLWLDGACPDLNTLTEHWSKVAGDRHEFLANLSEDRLITPTPFTLFSGAAGAMPLGGQMQHVVNHSTMHRGQVVGMIRQLGIVPPTTDLFAYLRQQLVA